MKRRVNVSAGPTKIPKSVKKRMRENMSVIVELSHRGKEFEKIVEKTKQNISELMSVPKDYSILFVNGGASSQYSNIVMNFVPYNYRENWEKQALYFISGYWSRRACEEAKRLGVNVISRDVMNSEKDTVFHVPNSVKYIHYCDNETIDGKEFSQIPLLDRKTNIICDMSSSILSKKVNIREYSMIYASAQKLLGIAGVTLVIINNEFLYKCSVKKYSIEIPKMIDYETYREMNSCYNTPPILAIYTMYEMSMWNLKYREEIERENKKKSEKLYKTIRKSKIFTRKCKEIENGVLKKSKMNVVFDLNEKYRHLRELFREFMEEKGINGYNGHINMGGYRISCYNQIRKREIKYIVKVLREFEYVFN